MELFSVWRWKYQIKYLLWKSKNNFVWKRPLGSLSTAINLTVSSPLCPCVPEYHIYKLFEQFHPWWFQHFLRQLVSVLDNSFREEIFPDLNLPWCNHFFLSYFLFPGRRGKSPPGSESSQAVVKGNKVPPSLLSSKINTLSCFSLDLCSSPFSISAALLWTCFRAKQNKTENKPRFRWVRCGGFLKQREKCLWNLLNP